MSGEVRRAAGGIAIAVLVGVACSGGDSEGDSPASTAAATSTETPVFESAPETTEPVQTLTVGVVLPSADDDGAFSQSMVEALDRIELPVETVVADQVLDREAAADAMRELADDGAALVIAHGAEFAGAVREVAAEAPDVVFAHGPNVDDPELPNLWTYEARSDQGAFALGSMAAALSTSGSVGVIGSVPVVDVALWADGFAAGVTASSSGATAEVTYIDSFDDGALGQEAARSVADRGADVLTATSQMSVAALEVAVERDLPWFGNYLDQTSLAPDHVVASQVYRWEVAIEPMLAAVADGGDGAAVAADRVVLTLDNGGLEVVYNDAVADESIRTVGEEAIGAVRSGSVLTGVD